MQQLTLSNPKAGINQEQLDRIEQRIKCQLSGRLRGFSLKCGSDGLVLRGRTRTYYSKQLAQHAVMDATDLPIVRNDIEVT